MDLSLFDPGNFAVAGVSLMLFTGGIVQVIKDWFNLEGKKVTVLSSLIGILVMVVFQVMQFLPETLVPYFEAGFLSIAFGLSTSGYYKFLTRDK